MRLLLYEPRLIVRAWCDDLMVLHNWLIAFDWPTLLVVCSSDLVSVRVTMVTVVDYGMDLRHREIPFLIEKFPPCPSMPGKAFSCRPFW